MGLDIEKLRPLDQVPVESLGVTRLNTCAAEEDAAACSLMAGHAGQHVEASVTGLIYHAWGDVDRDEQLDLTDDEEAAINELLGAYEEIDSAISSAYMTVMDLQQKFKPDTALGKMLDDLWVRHEACDILEVPGELFEGDRTSWARFLHG